jgi:superfamily II DNA or RNA helicase
MADFVSGSKPVILILHPLKWFGIVGAELRRVDSLGQFMTVAGTVRSEQVDVLQEDLRLLAELCEQLRPDSLYTRYANKKVFRHEEDFWATKERVVRTHVKKMADMHLMKAVGLADKLDIPILYAEDKKGSLHISDRLTQESSTEVTPVMNFRRHDEGTTYRLQLRIGDRLVERPSDHHLVVLTYNPGMFILDKHIYTFCEGFSGQLLLPFIGKEQVEIPRKMENDYFHRFILKQVARADIHAEGFDITDISHQPLPCLTSATAVDGSYILSLSFRYGSLEYEANSKVNGRVTLSEADGCFQFVRQLRSKAEEQRLTKVLRQLTGAGTISRFPSASQLISWLREYAPQLKEQGFEVVQPSDHVYYIGPLNVEQTDTWQGDWLQTEVTVVVDDGRLCIPFRDLRSTILQGEQEYMLPTGEILFIPDEWLKRYADLVLIGQPKGQGFQRHRSQVESGESGADRPGSATAKSLLSSVITVVSPKLKAKLRPYQRTGFQWLWQNFVAQTGCCLSDEMGLGKTLQTIALLLQYKEKAKASQPVSQPMPGMLFTDEEMQGSSREADSCESFHLSYRTSLVVAPASVVHNWRNELKRFAPSLSVMTYAGDIKKRKGKRKALMRWDVVLTTYRTLLNDIDVLSQNEFGIVVFDESQAFKTAASQIHQAVTRLLALHRMALSGTPVENNLQELWSLMNVLNPNLLGDARSFQNAFVNPIAVQMEDKRRELLRSMVAPYFLKRTKEEVLSDLPERQDEVVVCTMSDEQTSQYAAELSKARNEWLDPHTSSQGRQIHLLAAIQRLRQIANGEGKLTVVFDYLENLRQTQHKVLVFSEYVSLLEQVGREMTNRGWNYALLTGQTRCREQVIARFQGMEQREQSQTCLTSAESRQNSTEGQGMEQREQSQTCLTSAESRQNSTEGQQPPDCQFFLISLKAGGVGLNLTAADYVFLLDPWWNRAAEEQAIARAHRIGQQRSVFVYRFVSAGTLEEQILTLQDHKQSLIDSVMPFICNSSKATKNRQ